MLKHKKVYLSLFFVFILLSILSSFSIEYLKNQRDELRSLKHLEQVKSMRQELSSMILQKQKATVAMALSMANDNSLSKSINKKKIPEEYYAELVNNLREYTLYKNIWVQIFDAKAVSLYRSWSRIKGDSLIHLRKDIENVINTKRVSFSISVGKFDLSIKAIVPVFYDKKFVGVVEVISHFNSIAKQQSLHEVDSVVVLRKEYKEQLKYPFTEIFIGDYYVANLNASQKKMEYLQKNGIENYFNDSYKIENGYLIVSYPLKNIHERVIGYFIMFKKIDSISNLDLDFFMFKAIAFIIIALMTIAMMISSLLYFANKRQRKYYQNIIDSSKNIVVINNKKSLILVNKAFFKYFTSYKSLEEFSKEHECICDYFIEEYDYMGTVVDGLNWVDYLIQHHTRENKVKMRIEDKEYYFSLTASLVSEDSGHYSIVFSDITLAENYQQELEKLTITDTLTGIGNRRYFHHKMKEEIARAKRNKDILSVIMFDIDNFKDVNDEYGHDVGDEVLIEYTSLISSFLRDTDIFCRIGGEEFMIILPQANKEDALKIAEKIRKEIQEYKKIVPITMSFGVTQYIKGEDIEFIFKRVDSALYRAKEAGRNKVHG